MCSFEYFQDCSEGYEGTGFFPRRGINGLLNLMSGIWAGIWTLPFVDGLRLLAARVRLVISRLALIFVLPLDFHGRVRVVRSMYLPAALHG